MGYPAAYRAGSLQPRPGVLPGPRGQVIPFPNPRPGSGRFGPPVRLPGRPTFGLRPNVTPRLPSGASRFPSVGAVFGAASVAADVALGLYVGWQAWNVIQGHRHPRICPPDGFLVAWGYTEDLTKHCGRAYNFLTDQAVYPSCPITYQVLPSSLSFSGVSQRPTPVVFWLDTYTINIVNGNHNCYGSQVWIRTVTVGPSLISLQGASHSYVSPYYPDFMPAPAPADYPVPLPTPVNWIPYVPFELPSVRDYGIAPPMPRLRPSPIGLGPPGAITTRVVAGASDNPRSRPSITSRPGVPPQRKPPERDPEKKPGAKTAAGIIITEAAKIFAHVGTANGFINVFWDALPAKVRAGTSRTTIGRLNTIAANLDEIQFGPAFTNALRFAIGRRLAGQFYGKALKSFQRVFGRDAGVTAFRVWLTASGYEEHIQGERAYAARARANRLRRYYHRS